jgi:flagellar motor switch protein FliM
VSAPGTPQLLPVKTRSGKLRPPGPRPDARAFDPRHPGRLASTHRRALALVYEAFARHFASTLATHLRSPATVSVLSVEQRDYGSLVTSASDPACLAALSLEPLAGMGVIDISLPLAMSIIERLLGGSGEGPHPDRPLTSLEIQLLATVIDAALPELSSSFAPLCPVNFKVVRYEAKAELLKAAPSSDAFAHAVLEVDLGDLKSTVTIALPLTPLEPAFDAFAGTSSTRSAATGNEPLDIANLLLDSPVELSLHFSPVPLTGAEILGLTVGDIIGLGHPTDGLLTVDVVGIPMALARPGRQGGRLACVIAQPVDPETLASVL